jgi:hypothetical protein
MTAIFSPCGTYRYRLTRGDGEHRIAFCMLNPSTADAELDDQTIARCRKRSTLLGFDRMDVVNIFALRSTDPKKLYKVKDPAGPDNMRHIGEVAAASEIVICAWGKHGALGGTGRKVLAMLNGDHPGKAHYLRLNDDGSPEHPLYVPYEVVPARLLTTT